MHFVDGPCNVVVLGLKAKTNLLKTWSCLSLDTLWSWFR